MDSCDLPFLYNVVFIKRFRAAMKLVEFVPGKHEAVAHLLTCR